jgi:ABC-type sugar transport system permease subunit
VKLHHLPRGLALAVVLGVLVYFAFIFVLPGVQAFWYGFHVVDILTDTTQFLGLRNFERLVDDDRFWSGLRVSAIFVVCELAVGMSLSLLLGAMLTTLRGARQTIVILLFFLPAVLPNMAVIIIWQAMNRPGYGLFDQLLGGLGLPPAPWQVDPLLVVGVIVASTVWKYIGTSAIVWMTGLNSIPHEIYEAAMIDGAGRVRQFFSLSLPLLRPLLVFNVVISVIVLLQFADPFIALRVPALSPDTESLMVYIYRTSFLGLNFGYGAAMTVVMFGLLLIISAAQLRVWRSHLHTE